MAMMSLRSLTWVTAAVEIAVAQGAGCSDVPKLIFENGCDEDVYLDGWQQTIGAYSSIEIYDKRPLGDDKQRIQFKYANSEDWQYDFIELNVDWEGPGSCFAGHTSYSSYNGYSMASKYEAFVPDTSDYACKDPGAMVDYQTSECPTQAADGYQCVGTKMEGRCTEPVAELMKGHSRAINQDGSISETTELGNFVNYWCSEMGGFNTDWGTGPTPVGVLMDCVDNSIPFDLKITTCSTGMSSKVSRDAPEAAVI